MTNPQLILNRRRNAPDAVRSTDRYRVVVIVLWVLACVLAAAIWILS